MQKLVSLGVVLLIVFGISCFAQPAGALPFCTCAFCAFSPNAFCFNNEDGGFRYPCRDYVEVFCSDLTADSNPKDASASDVFSPQIFGASLSAGQACGSAPIAQPGI